MARPTVPAQPFADWLNKRVARYETLDKMAEALGIAERTLYRYRHCLGDDGRKTDTFIREHVDVMLRNAGFWLWDVYDDPELYEVEEVSLCPQKALMHPDLLLQAKQLYEDGLNCREVAAQLYDGSGYASPNSLRLAVRKEFINQGWPLKTQSEESMRRWREGRMVRVPCDEQGCRKAAGANGFCLFHDPDQRDRVVEMIGWARSHVKAEFFPLEPFRVWLLGEVEDAGGFTPVAERVGCHRTSVANWARGEQYTGGVKYEVSEIRRDTAERYLAAYGLALDDIYLVAA